MLHARAAFLAKDKDELDDALKYRILMILPVTHRTWAKLRLRHLQPWIEDWATEDLFAGVGCVGAEDAWWQTAVTFEQANINGTPLTGGVADIWKCFDQILRPLLFTIPVSYTHLTLPTKRIV